MLRRALKTPFKPRNAPSVIVRSLLPQLVQTARGRIRLNAEINKLFENVLYRNGPPDFNRQIKRMPQKQSWRR